MIRWLLDGPLKGFPDLPPVWLLGFMAAAWAIDRGLPLVEAFGPVYRVAGGLLMLAALGLIAWSALWFWRKKTTIEPHHTPTALIVEGPYRLSRNPIYLALLALLAGYVLRLGSLGPVILPFAYYIVLTRRFIEPEEAGPEAAFRGGGACVSGKHPPLALGHGAGGCTRRCHILSRRLDWFIWGLRLKWAVRMAMDDRQ
jgi:hypothetical protein